MPFLPNNKEPSLTSPTPEYVQKMFIQWYTVETDGEGKSEQ